MRAQTADRLQLSSFRLRTCGVRCALLAACGLWLVASAYAARLESGPNLTIEPAETQAGDLYYGGNGLRIEGRVDGSVLAGANTIVVSGAVSRNLFAGGQTIDISGAVGGDVLAGAMNVTVSGPVAGAIRAGAQTITVDSTVGADLLAGCRDLTVGRNAVVAGDVIAGCQTLDIAGTVHGDVRTAASDVTVSGIIDGDLICTVGRRITLAEDARVFGNLVYRAERELEIGNRDAVFGDVRFIRQVEPREIGEIGKVRPRPGLITSLLLPFALLSVLAALAVVFLLIAIWKGALTRAIDGCLDHFGRTVGFGAIGLFATPVAIVVALALIITIPLGLVGGLLYLAGLYLAKVLAGILVGRWLFRVFGGATASVWLTAPVGIILVYALCAIPFAGWILGLFAAFIGFGVIVELLAASRRT